MSQPNPGTNRETETRRDGHQITPWGWGGSENPGVQVSCAPPPLWNGGGCPEWLAGLVQTWGQTLFACTVFAQGGGRWPSGHMSVIECEWPDRGTGAGGGMGDDSVICPASLPPEIPRNWVKVYHVLGLGHFGSEVGHVLPQGNPYSELRILSCWHSCLALAPAHSKVEGGPGPWKRLWGQARPDLTVCVCLIL